MGRCSPFKSANLSSISSTCVEVGRETGLCKEVLWLLHTHACTSMCSRMHTKWMHKKNHSKSGVWLPYVSMFFFSSWLPEYRKYNYSSSFISVIFWFFDIICVLNPLVYECLSSMMFLGKIQLTDFFLVFIMNLLHFLLIWSSYNYISYMQILSFWVLDFWSIPLKILRLLFSDTFIFGGRGRKLLEKKSVLLLTTKLNGNYFSLIKFRVGAILISTTEERLF